MADALRHQSGQLQVVDQEDIELPILEHTTALSDGCDCLCLTAGIVSPKLHMRVVWMRVWPWGCICCSAPALKVHFSGLQLAVSPIAAPDCHQAPGIQLR